MEVTNCKLVVSTFLFCFGNKSRHGCPYCIQNETAFRGKRLHQIAKILTYICTKFSGKTCDRIYSDEMSELGFEGPCFSYITSNVIHDCRKSSLSSGNERWQLSNFPPIFHREFCYFNVVVPFLVQVLRWLYLFFAKEGALLYFQVL